MEPNRPQKIHRGRPAVSPGVATFSFGRAALAFGRAVHSIGCAVLAVAPATFGATVHAAELTPPDIILLDRLTWGINASSAAHRKSSAPSAG